jgi:hypothetical protein
LWEVRWRRNLQWTQLIHFPSQSFYEALLGGLRASTVMFRGGITRATESSGAVISYYSSSSTSSTSIWNSSILSNVCVRPASRIIELRLMSCGYLYRMYVNTWYMFICMSIFEMFTLWILRMIRKHLGFLWILSYCVS